MSDPVENLPFLGVPLLDGNGRPRTGANGYPLWEDQGWWFHGDYLEPPAPGAFLQVPTGGVLKAVIASNKPLTPWSWNRPKDMAHPFAAWCEDDATCSSDYDRTGIAPMLHLPYGQRLNTPLDQVATSGCAFAIAYKSDLGQLGPEDFVVISIAAKCPFYKNQDFYIPAGLKECPPDGCHCMWAWNHEGGGPPAGMHMNAFRCKVTGNFGNRDLAKPAVARNCASGGCQAGPKQLHFWLQQERNNNFQPRNNPPLYNAQYGFNDGAQRDVFVRKPCP